MISSPDHTEIPMAELQQLGIDSVEELLNDAEYYSIDDEIYLYIDGLHILIAKSNTVELYESVHVGGHHVGGHYKSSSRQSSHWVSGYWRGGSTQRRFTGHRTDYTRTDPKAYVGPKTVCKNQYPIDFDPRKIGMKPCPKTQSTSSSASTPPAACTPA